MSEPGTRVQFSENESKLLNLRVGRCVSADFNEDELARQITAGKYDICRLTTPSSDEHAVLKLEKTGFPYYYSGSITRYKTPVADLPERNYIHDDLEFEQYDGSQNELLLQLLTGTWGTYPIGYYRTPYMKQLVSKEQEILCVFEFYKKHNLQKDFPNNTIMFIRHQGNYVGFFALNIMDDRLESHIGGIVQPYREGGYFFDMQEYIRRFCVQHNLKYFAFGARNENRRVQSIFQKFGYVAVDADNVFHLCPLLSFTGSVSPVEKTLQLNTDDETGLYRESFNACMDAWKTFVKDPAAKIKFSVIPLGNISAPLKAIISIPVKCENENMIVGQFFNESNDCCALAYLYSK